MADTAQETAGTGEGKEEGEEMICGEHYFDEMGDVVSKENLEFTERDWERIHKLLKRLNKEINTITYSYGDITVTIIKEKKKKK